MILDCLIVGGGPAGLSAALMLGRCRRRVLLCDMGETRNARARHMHAYPSRDGIPPGEFLRLVRAELGQYGTIECREVEIVDACREGNRFVALAADGTRIEARKLLLATGVVDLLPEIDGLPELYGASVHHCPFCDAWEWRDHPIAVYGCDDLGPGLALSLTAWSSDILLCTDGSPVADYAPQLRARGIAVREDRVVRLEGEGGLLQRIVFAEGEPAARRALFVACGQRQRSPLVKRLGCRLTAKGTVDTGKCESTNVPGLYVAGDASKEAQFVVVATAEGAEAGMAIHQSLMDEELQNASSTPSRASRGGP